ncbi:deoxyribose-phosphate aldolase [Coralliovum pocilloporae]|uniref:deoxyribose-phosphate aldolase n=1 Tax=Coralliovum pocilloporae TaxID=3066369 RepID=UPI003307C0C2
MRDQSIRDRDAAIRAIRLLDLTNLNDDCDTAAISSLCKLAQTPFGNTAAICIWSQFVEQAKAELAGTGIRIATVINFPHGGTDIQAVLQEADEAMAAGADELDLVFPYHAFMEGNHQLASDMIRQVKDRCTGDVRLKVILETGCLETEVLIREASRLAIEAGADFIKTSTGKVAVNATPEVAAYMLEEIASSGRDVGFKPAGGLKTASDAAAYLALADRILGLDWAMADRFRFGASSVLKALLATAEGREAGQVDEGY